ncbi:hypothetical protein niasHT_008749 [Heterodera trifolii]|uniref:Uncharacterized protein n=1 Tax=Heterodera trifolii TaxID=157864 RepID=A0ABD2M279_9BILA
MLTLNEFARWTGLTLFEMDLHSVALFLTSLLFVLSRHFLFSLTILHLFAPLFVASALNFYFLVIIFVRTVIEDGTPKRAIAGNALHFFRVTMVALFEMILCHKLQDEFERGNQQKSIETTYFMVLMPLWALLIALSVHACRLF